MSRGGHKGLLYPVSGVIHNIFGRKRKRGLYHHITSDIFRPRWGPIKESSISKDLNLLKWNNGTISPSEMLPSQNVYHNDVKRSWPPEATRHTFILYDINQKRYFKPAGFANTEGVRKYIYNVLDPLNIKKNGFLGLNLDSQHSASSQHISKIINFENESTKPKINLDLRSTEQRFKKLEGLIKVSDTWSTLTHSHKSSTNPFPHVNEGASLIRNLPLSEILFARSNHRLSRRAHPKWYNARYVKFVKKKEIKQKLNQLQLESSV